MNVILYGISGGLSYGPLGMTHHSLQDIATFTAIPGIEVHIPADRFQSVALIKDLIKNPRPAYIRVGRNAVEDVYNENDNDFDFSKAKIIYKGNDVAIIAVGEMVYYAKKAAEILKSEHNINALLVDMHTIKPLDENIIKQASNIGKIVTVEEHSIYGGLGSIVSRVASNYKPTKVKTFALPDEPVVAGKSKEVFEYYGLSVENIVKQVLEW
ncbi:MAG: transketolase family protein [Christensenellaceae bacterium]|nr:transketolase family protein [Christensenellaceae bacterium]